VLISYLENAFARSSNKIHVVNLIQNQFQGMSEYVTVCKACGRVSRQESSFYELELNVEVLYRFINQSRILFSFFIFSLSLSLTHTMILLIFNR
jgi:hypothetical protein